MKTGLITDDQRLIGAKDKYGSAIQTYDDSYGRLWIAGSSIHTYGIIRAKNFETAYEICEDEFADEASETIEELIKEYGFKRAHVRIVSDPIRGERESVYPDDFPNGMLSDKLLFVRWETRETPDPNNWTENELFQAAYGFRPNGPNTRDKLGHGIYAKDLNGDHLDELTEGIVKEMEITLEIESEE